MTNKTPAPTTKQDKAPAAVAAVPKVSLTEFCTRLSETVRRFGLIAAFEHTEKAAGRLSDTADAYAKRFDQFSTAIVQ